MPEANPAEDPNPDDLTDNSTPLGSGLLDFTDVSGRDRGTVFRTPKAVGTHDQETRKLIAVIILLLVSLLYLAIMYAFLTRKIDKDMLSAAITAISGVQALAAAAIGFYYGSKKKG